MSEQLVLELNAQPQGGFVEGAANVAVNTAIKSELKLIILGGALSGKTQISQSLGFLSLQSVDEIEDYLARGVAQHCVIDDADVFAKGAQTALFHLYNFQQAHQVKLILFASQSLSQWPIDLPDLKSRLETFAEAKIEAPDDMMIVQILAKMFLARGVIVSHDLVEYVAKRVERSYVSLDTAVVGIDRLAGHKHKVTKKLAKQYFEEQYE